MVTLHLYFVLVLMIFQTLLIFIISLYIRYLAVGGVKWADDSDELLRMTRLLRGLSIESFLPSIVLIRDVFADNSAPLLITGYIASICWLVFSTLLYLTESDNNDEDAGMEMGKRFEDVPNSLQYSAIFL